MRKLLKTYQNAEPDSPDSISSSSSSSPELHVPQPERQKKQPASTTTKPQKPDAKVIGWVDGITSQAPPEGRYEFRSITPSPELPAYLQPPACTPPSSHSPPSPSPPPDSQLSRNQLLNTIRQLEKKVNTLTERSVIQEFSLTKLVKQNEHLIHLVQELLENQPQTASRPPLPLHRPWNVTLSTPTRPSHSVSIPANNTIWFTNNSGNKWQHYISAEHLFPVPDYNQHPLFLLTLTTSSNTFQPSTEFQVQLLLQSSTPPRVLATLQST